MPLYRDEAALCSQLAALEAEFLAAVRSGPDQVSAFNRDMLAVFAVVNESTQAHALSTSTIELAASVFTTISNFAETIHDFESTTRAMSTPNDDTSGTSSPAALPLFRYMIDNICHPYPDAEEKERIAEETRNAGWPDFDKKKCEDWLNRKRHQSGYVAIARKYCDEDTEVMRSLCYAALFGSPEQRARVHPDALDEIEDMQELLQVQYDDLRADELSPWVDELAHGLGDFVALPSTDHSTPDSLSSDNEEADYADCSDDEFDTDSDESDESATDLDSDLDDDEVTSTSKEVVDSPMLSVIGTKRKVSDLPSSPPPRSHRVSRTPSSSSSGSSSASTSSAASFRSFSGGSVSSTTSWEEDECDRPAKRICSQSLSPEPESVPFDSSRTVDLWAMRVPTPVALSKRKRDDDDLETLARNMKRSRYAALSAAAPSNIPAHHLASLTDVCTRSWSNVVPFEVLSFSVDSELYTVDCTAMQDSIDEDGEDEDEDNNLSDIIDLCNDPDAPDDATWATVQLHALAQALTGSRLPMAAELCADTVEVKLEELSPQELSSLGETLATTAESITAEYPLDQSLLLEDDDAFNPPELSDGESSGSSSPDRSPSPPVELESSPERLIADYAMSTRTRKELDTLQHPWFAQMFGQQGLSFFDPNTFRVECNPPPGMMVQESHSDFLVQLDL